MNFWTRVRLPSGPLAHAALKLASTRLWLPSSVACAPFHGGSIMNILFWIWYRQIDKCDDEVILPGDDYIPNPWYLVVGLVIYMIILAACYAAVFF